MSKNPLLWVKRKFRWWWIPVFYPILYIVWETTQYFLQVAAIEHFYRNNMRAELSDPRAFQQEFIDRGLVPEDQSFEWTDTFTPYDLNFDLEKNEASIQEIADLLVPISDRDIWIDLKNGDRDWSRYKLAACGQSYCPTGDVETLEVLGSVPNFVISPCPNYYEIERHFGFRLGVLRRNCSNLNQSINKQVIVVYGPATNFFTYVGRGLTPYKRNIPYAAAPFYGVSSRSPKNLFTLKDGTYDPIIVTRY